MSAELFLVATPLGNPQDLSPRAIEVLEAADLILCEDTRKTQRLFQDRALKINGKLLAIPGDSEWQKDWARFDDKKHWVLVSDAGTPVINDPGLALIRFFEEKGWPVRVVPGPSAPVAALQWSGGFGVPWVFLGFVPKLKHTQKTAFAQFFRLLPLLPTLIYFDTKHQCLDTLEYLREAHGPDRKIYVARELSKPHEELLRGTIREVEAELRQRLERDEGMGEMTFVLEGASQLEVTKAGETAQLSLEELIQFRSASIKEASHYLAKLTGLGRKICYDALVKEKS